MPINKAAKFRFDIIDECLRNTKKKWSKATLLQYINRRLALHFGEEISISASQLRYDLTHMQTEMGAPIEMYREGKNYYYKYEEQDFSIKNIPIDEQDLATLKDAIQLLRHIKGFTLAEEMSEMVSRLESKYNSNTGDVSRIISFEDPQGPGDTAYLQDIYESIRTKIVLKLMYKSFNATSARIWHIHPYLLKAYHNRWYLLGHCTEKGNIGIYALERIEDIKVSNIAFIENNEEGDMFRDIIGVTFLHNKNKEHIELLFSGKFAPYIKMRPLHPSQKIVSENEDGSLHVQLSVIVNPELISTILSYGNDAKVLRPSGLAEEVHHIVMDAAAQYETKKKQG